MIQQFQDFVKKQKCVIFGAVAAFKSELVREFYEGDGFIFCLIWAILVPVLILTLLELLG